VQFIASALEYQIVAHGGTWDKSLLFLYVYTLRHAMLCMVSIADVQLMVMVLELEY
jgi:hypothetical protein